MFAVAKWLKSVRASIHNASCGVALYQRQRKHGRKSRFQRLELELLESRILLRGGIASPNNWINPSSGNWDVPSNWSTGAVPGASDSVSINTSSAATITIQSGDAESAASLNTAANDMLSITGGSLAVASSGIVPPSTLNGGLAMTGGSLTAAGLGTVVTINNPTIESGANLFATGGAALNLYGAWTNNGTISVDSSSTIGLGSPIAINPASSGAANYVWTNSGAIAIANGATVNLGGVFTTDDFNSFTQQLGNSASLAQDTVTLVGTLDNSAADNPLSGGILSLNATTGPLELSGGEIYQGSITANGSDDLTFAGGQGGTLDGVTINGDLNIDGACVVQGGVTTNGDLNIDGNCIVMGGVAVNGDLDIGANSTLTLDAPSKVSVSGNFTEASSAILNEQIAGAAASDNFGQLAIAGTATLAGSFSATDNGFTPSSPQDFAVITFASASGTFSQIVAPPNFTNTLNATIFDVIAQVPIIFTADTPPAAIVGSPYSYQFQANGTAPIMYTAGSLPFWAQLDPMTGILSGTPTTGGFFSFNVTAGNGLAPDAMVSGVLEAEEQATTFNVAAGTAFTVPSGIYADGTTFNVGANATVSAGNATYTGGVTFNVGANATVSTGNVTNATYSGGVIFSIATGAVVDLGGSFAGTLTGSGAGTVELSSVAPGLGGLTPNFPGGMLQWTGGFISESRGNVTNLGTLNLSGASDKGFFDDGTFDNFGTIIQTGAGNLTLHSDNVTATTLKNEAGASYLIESDSGIDNSFGGATAMINAGTIRKTAGAGTSRLLINGSITNTGVIEADSGTLYLDAPIIGQLSGTTLTAGTWNALNGATLEFPGGTAVNLANIALSGAGATISAISGLTSNSGSFSLTDGANFTTAGDFSNSGILTVGEGSTLTVGGNFTQTPAGTFNDEMGGAPATGEFGQVNASGTASLAGSFDLSFVNNFGPLSGQTFPVLTFGAASNNFTSFTGLYPFFVQSLGAASLDLIDNSENAVDLQIQSVTAPLTAAAGQPITVDWTVSNPGGQAAAGNWQDSIYLSATPTITPASILLGSAVHTGGLPGDTSYNGSLTAAVPGIIPGGYYVLVVVDSLYEVPDPNRSSNTLAAANQLQVSVPALTLGAPYSDSFTANDQGRYYEIAGMADGSLLLTLTDSPASEDNSIYVSLNSLPTPYQADYQSSGSSGPDQTLAAPTTEGGIYYVLVYNESGAPGAYNLTASLPGLTLLSASPGDVGNAGQATLTVAGLDLETDTTYALSGPGGTIKATATNNVSSALAYVTFNFIGVTPGAYELKAMNDDGAAATLAGAVHVTAGGGADVTATLLADSPVRIGRTSIFYVQYANLGDDDAPAPLLTITSPLDVPMTLDSTVTPQALNLVVLGYNQNGPVAVLPPGVTGQYAVYFLPSSSNGEFEFDVTVTNPSDADAFTSEDWQDDVLSAISPNVTGAANWPAVETQLQQLVGATWGSYVNALDHYAALLPLTEGDPSSPADVLQLAVNQAVAAVGTSISGVAAPTAPGVPLGGNTITATNSTTGDIFTATLLNDGSFVFPTVTPGSYTFSVADTLIDGSPVPVTVNGGQAAIGVKVTLDPEVILTGQVTAAATGAPVTGGFGVCDVRRHHLDRSLDGCHG